MELSKTVTEDYEKARAEYLASRASRLANARAERDKVLGERALKELKSQAEENLDG